MGDDRGALKFAHKKSNSEAFHLYSSGGAWFWSQALLDYRYNQHRGFAEEYYGDANEPESSNLFDNSDGSILRAFQLSPMTLSFLTGERKLPNCAIPFQMGNYKLLSNAGVYCLSNAEMWRNTCGALEWAAFNCRTFLCSLILNPEREALKSLEVSGSPSHFQTLLNKGVFLDAKLGSCGKTLVHEAVCNQMPKHLKMLVDAGAEVTVRSSLIPQPLHMCCYYNFHPKIIKILCNAGTR